MSTSSRFLFRLAALAAVPVMLAAGCGADSSTDPEGVDGTGDGTGGERPIGEGTGDGTGGEGTGAEPEPEPEFSGTCTGNIIDPAFELGGRRDGATYYYASEEPSSGFMVWYVEVADGVEPGTYDLADQPPGRCDICVYALDNCDASTQSCSEQIDATEGSIELTAVSTARLAGTLHNVKFGSSDGLCADDHSFDVAVAPDEPATIGDQMLDFQLLNCGTGEMMSMQELASNTKGFWFVGTAGWCPACRRFLPQVLDILDQVDPSVLDVAFVVGEDDSYNEPDLDFCRRYADRYGAPYDLFFIDHNGTFSFATLFQFLSPHSGPNGQFGLPWNGIVRGDQDFEYVYSDGTGQDLNEALDEILGE